MSVFNLGIDDASANKSNEEVLEQKNTSDSEVIVADKKEEKKEEKTIVLDGPLSHIYTQALNLVYANEASNMMLQMTMDADEVYGDKAPDGKDVYVYCCNGDNFTGDDLVGVSNKLRLALDSNKYKNIVLAIECNSIVSSKIGLLNDFSTSIGIPVCYSKSKALEVIKNKLEG